MPWGYCNHSVNVITFVVYMQCTSLGKNLLSVTAKKIATIGKLVSGNVCFFRKCFFCVYCYGKFEITKLEFFSLQQCSKSTQSSKLFINEQVRIFSKWLISSTIYTYLELSHFELDHYLHRTFSFWTLSSIISNFLIT